MIQHEVVKELVGKEPHTHNTLTLHPLLGLSSSLLGQRDSFLQLKVVNRLNTVLAKTIPNHSGYSKYLIMFNVIKLFNI